MIIIVVLVASTIGVLALANVLIGEPEYTVDPLIQGNISERIEPVGSVTVNGEATMVAEAESSSGDASAAEQNAGASVEEMYQACNACHATGVLSAPKLGDKVAWEPRLAKGIETMYTNAINGIGGMPPKGGRVDLSDDDIKKLVDYMVASVQ